MIPSKQQWHNLEFTVCMISSWQWRQCDLAVVGCACWCLFFCPWVYALWDKVFACVLIDCLVKCPLTWLPTWNHTDYKSACNSKWDRISLGWNLVGRRQGYDTLALVPLNPGASVFIHPEHGGVTPLQCVAWVAKIHDQSSQKVQSIASWPFNKPVSIHLTCNIHSHWPGQ